MNLRPFDDTDDSRHSYYDDDEYYSSGGDTNDCCHTQRCKHSQQAIIIMFLSDCASVRAVCLSVCVCVCVCVSLALSLKSTVSYVRLLRIYVSYVAYIYDGKRQTGVQRTGQ